MFQIMKRTYKDKCSIQWHESWTQLRDSQGDKVGRWGVRQSDSHGKCTWCQTIFRFDGKGSHAFLEHAKCKKHKFNSDGQQGRMMNQRSVLNTQPEDEWREEDDISSNLGEAEEDADSPGVVPGEEEVDRSGCPQTGGLQVGGGRFGLLGVRRGEGGRGRGQLGGEREASSRRQEGDGQENSRGVGETHLEGRGQNRDRGGGRTRRRVARPPQQAAQNSMPFNDRVTYAEIRMTLLGVEHDYSYLSMKNWQQALSSCDPSSQVFKTVVLNPLKISILVRFGLFPYMRDSMIRRIKEGGDDGGFFTLGTDECVVRHLGIQKHMDIHARYWLESAGRVEDAFLDLHSVGHAPADRQVEDILKTLVEVGLSPVKVVGLSRDNPTVMQAVARLLKLSLSDLGNPALIDLKCFLHPTNTAFEKLEENLGEHLGEQQGDDDDDDEEEEEERVSISSLLSNLHSFINSTARREDMTMVGEELAGDEEFNEDLNQFFKRHVVTRWLEMEPCLKRLLSRWKTSVHYFTIFLPNSSSPTDKKALKTDRFKTIYNALKPSQEQKTKAKVKFLHYICKLTLPFLTTFQATKPMVHLLYTDSTEMFEALARLIMKADKFQYMENNCKYTEIDFYDKDNLLPMARMTSLSSLIMEESNKMSTTDFYMMLYSMRGGLQKMLTYLQSHLPFNDPFYKSLGFLAPAVRRVWTSSKLSLVNAAKIIAQDLGRFDEEDLMDLQRQLEIYQSLRDVPNFDPKEDRVDEWWVKVWDMMEKERGERPRVLIKLVKMCCVLSHSQAWVERGFNISKMFATDRESLSLHSMKALKTIH